MNADMCDFSALEDLSDHWHSQLQSTPDDRFKALSMCVDTNSSVERARDLIDQQHIDLLRSRIQEKECKIDTLRQQYEIDTLLNQMNCETPRRPFLSELFVCDVDGTGRIQAKDWPIYRHDCCDCDPMRRDRRGRFVRRDVETETETVKHVIGNEHTTQMVDKYDHNRNLMVGFGSNRIDPDIKPLPELGENQIIRDDWLIQQYPYPDMTLELVIAYVGTGKEIKTSEPQETWVVEKPEFKPWFERLLMFLLNLVRRIKN